MTSAALQEPTSRREPRDLVLPAIVALAFAVTALKGWGHFGDLIVDTGRELDVPRRLLAGERLYAEVRWYYGPLAPWVNTALYRAFGVHVNVLAAAGLVSAASMATLVYLLARRFTGQVASAGAALAFTWLGAFASDRACGFNICNFVLPYSFAATYGMLCAASSLLFLIRHAQGGRAADFGLACAMLGLTALAKLEPLAAAVAAHAVFAVGSAFERRVRPWPHLVGWFVTGILVAAVYGTLALRVGPALWTENLHALANASSGPFIAWSMGLDDVPASLRMAAWSAGLLGAVIALAIAAARLVHRPHLGAIRAALAPAAAALAFTLFAWAGPRLAFRALPFAMAVVLLSIGWKWMRGAAARPDLLPKALLWTFGLVALGRILLSADLAVYGFYLLPVGLICLAALIAEEVPNLLGDAVSRRTVFAFVAAGALVGAGAAALRDTLAMIAERHVAVVSPRGVLRLPERQAPLIRMMSLLSTLPAGARLLTVPEGAGFNFFSGLEAADAFSSHLPMEFPDDAADRALLAQLISSPPEFVLVIPRSTVEFGFRGFGDDYARQTGAWLGATYEPVTTTGGGVLLFRYAPAGRGY